MPGWLLDQHDLHMDCNPVMRAAHRDVYLLSAPMACPSAAQTPSAWLGKETALPLTTLTTLILACLRMQQPAAAATAAARHAMDAAGPTCPQDGQEKAACSAAAASHSLMHLLCMHSSATHLSNKLKLGSSRLLHAGVLRRRCRGGGRAGGAGGARQREQPAFACSQMIWSRPFASIDRLCRHWLAPLARGCQAMHVKREAWWVHPVRSVAHSGPMCADRHCCPAPYARTYVPVDVQHLACGPTSRMLCGARAAAWRRPLHVQQHAVVQPFAWHSE